MNFHYPFVISIFQIIWDVWKLLFCWYVHFKYICIFFKKKWWKSSFSQVPCFIPHLKSNLEILCTVNRYGNHISIIINLTCQTICLLFADIWLLIILVEVHVVGALAWLLGFIPDHFHLTLIENTRFWVCIGLRTIMAHKV